MNSDDSKLNAQLKARQQAGNFRSLKTSEPDLIDFSSNDYLGLAQSTELKELILSNYAQESFKNGSTGSRLLTGNAMLTERVESQLSNLFLSEKSLLFSSGYMANLAFFSSVPQKDDVIIYDELIHACVKDGCRLSMAKKSNFRHNDLNHLSKKLDSLKSTGQVFVAVESVYSMDGDFAPLKAISSLCSQYNAKLIVDEAHSTGIFGEYGNGLVAELGLENAVYAKIMTFGKAMGIHGACICGNQTLINYLINFARPFIYTTAPGPFEVVSIKSVFDFLSSNEQLVDQLHSNIASFNDQSKPFEQHLISSESAIQIVKVKGNDAAKNLSETLKTKGFDVRAILSPTVGMGNERLRICIHAFNSELEISALCQTIDAYFQSHNNL